MIRSEARGNGLWRITLDRPDKANALTAEMLDDLAAAFEDLIPQARAIVLTGEGKTGSVIEIARDVRTVAIEGRPSQARIEIVAIVRRADDHIDQAVHRVGAVFGRARSSHHLDRVGDLLDRVGTSAHRRGRVGREFAAEQQVEDVEQLIGVDRLEEQRREVRAGQAGHAVLGSCRLSLGLVEDLRHPGHLLPASWGLLGLELASQEKRNSAVAIVLLR